MGTLTTENQITDHFQYILYFLYQYKGVERKSSLSIHFFSIYVLFFNAFLTIEKNSSDFCK